MTQQNAALVEQAAAAAESLHEQTVNLSKAVAVFSIDERDELPGMPDGEDDADFADDVPQLAGDPDAGFRDLSERRSPRSPMRSTTPALARRKA